MAGRVMNHVRDAIYGIVANPSMTPAQQADMLKRISDANAQADQISQTVVPGPLDPAPLTAADKAMFERAKAAGMPTAMPAQSAPPSAAFPTPVTPPVASFAPMPAGPSMAAGTPPTAAVGSFPDVAPPGTGEEIDRQKALALAALAQPTTYPRL